MQEQSPIAVPCRDGFGREKFARMFLNDNADVVFVAPAGETAVWHPGDIPRVMETLRALAVEGTNRKGARR